MESATMGKVIVQAKIENLQDLFDVERDFYPRSRSAPSR